MKKDSLDILAPHLKIPSLEKQEIKVGGLDYSVLLSSIIVSASAPFFPSFDWSALESEESDGLGDSVYNASYFSGGNNGNNGEEFSSASLSFYPTSYE